MSGGSHGELIGRSAELALLDRVLVEVRTGRPWVTLVEGAAGIGKTALLRRVARDARDFTLVWTSGDAAESVVEFGVMRQLLAGTSASIPTGGDRFAVGAALLAGLSELEQRGPVLLVVDDLHWADRASAQELLFCLRRLRADPVLVLMACRPAGLQQFAPGWARLLADGDLAHHIELAGLSAGEVGELAAVSGRKLGHEAATRLATHTGGNPLYLTALLTEQPDNTLHRVTGHLPAPRVYATGVLSRVARLTSSARELVCVVAVLGDRAETRVATAVAGLPRDTDVLDEAVGAGLLDMAAGGDEIAFAHPLARAAVYDDLAPSHRRRLHLAAAALLPSAAGFAHRVGAASSGFDGELATDLISAALAAQVSGSLGLAAQYLTWAWQVDGRRKRAQHSLFDAVRLLIMVGDVRAAREHVPAVLACPSSPERRFTLALVAGAQGDLARAKVDMHVVATAARADDDVLFGNCSSWLAVVYSMLGQDVEAISWAVQAQAALASPRAAGAMPLQVRACGCARLGRFEETFALLDGCSPLKPDPDTIDAELLAIRGAVRNWSGDWVGAGQDLRAVLRWQRGGIAIVGIIEAYTGLAEAELRCGEWPAATLHIELGLSLAADLDQIWHAAYAHAVAAQLCAWRGDPVAATEHSTAAAEVARAFPSSDAQGYLAMARAHAAWARTDPAAVIEALRPLADDPHGSAGSHPNLALWRYQLAEAYLAHGKVDAARRLREQVPELSWSGACEADLARLDAALLHAVGDTEGAVQTYAAAMPQPGSRRLADGLLALDHGRLLIGEHQRKSAEPVLQTAWEIFAGLGAARLVADTDRALRACGVTGPQAAQPLGRLHLLTGREQTIARLVASGMTNREVATELYISAKTVEYHLSGVFIKLGIHSRREVAAALGNWPAAAAGRPRPSTRTQQP